MFRRLLILMLLPSFFSMPGKAQSSFFAPADSLNKKRLTAISITTGTAWAGSMTALYGVWYSKQDLTSFHSYDDSRSWLQMDKAGHVYTAWKISHLTTSMFKWSGLERKRSLLIGSSVAWGYQATLEVFDGMSEGWGFSWADLASNTLGVVSYATQELGWKEQRILPKFSYHQTVYATYRPSVLGSNFSERLLKDYNGQTYWISFSPSTFVKESKLPAWLCFSIGYSADARLYGDQDISTFTSDGVTEQFNSSREWLFSLDLDLSRIPVKKPWLKVVLNQLNYLKIPFPALMLRDGKIYGKAIYF